MRFGVATTVASILLIGLAVADDAKAMVRTQINITPRPLELALQELAKDSEIQLIYKSELVRGVESPGATGDLTPLEALRSILSGTGLTYNSLNDHTITIVPVSKGGPARKGTQTSSTSGEAPASFRMAQTQSTSAAGVASSASASASPVVTLEEVVVTAQKRAERLQDVPVPVTSINAEVLLASNQLRLQDYFTSVPGLSLASDGARNGFATLAIRGITTGPGTNPTVGITVDDVPYGSSTLLGGGDWVPDLDPSDLSRVEVLRGPQGTLYGASSMGGLVKYVTVDPSTGKFSGQIQAGISEVHNGPNPGYNVRASLNVPVGDTLAVRLSGFTRRDPGYVDRHDPDYVPEPITTEGVNQVKVSGGRLSALWQPSTNMTLKIGALLQHDQADGSPNVLIPPGLGDLQQRALRDSGGYDRKSQVFNANFNAKWGAIELTSVTGYSVNTIENSIDYTFALGPFTQGGIPALGFAGFGTPGTEVLEHNKTKRFTQELRLALPLGDRIDWLIGGFYGHESSPYTQDIVAVDAVTTAQVGTWGTLGFPTSYRELAAFTDLTFRLTEQFDVQFGARESHINQRASASNVGLPYNTVFIGQPVQTVIFPPVDTSDNAFTYLVTPRLKLTSDLMIYARLASGYRAGGANLAPNVPNHYSPDKTRNYELGAKADWLEHTLSLDASVYYIDWKNIQLGLLDPASQQGFNVNASRARSQGIELSVQSRPLPGLQLAAWVAFNDATLREGFPQESLAYGVPGARLPYSSRFSGNLSVDQAFPLTGSVEAFVGGSLSYLSERFGPFPSIAAPTQRQVFPAYARTDLRAGLKFGSWKVNLFGTNVTDRRAIISGGIAALNPTALTYIQPRTFGLSVARSF